MSPKLRGMTHSIEWQPLLYVVPSLVFRMPQKGGVVRGAVQRNTILFLLEAYSLWNLWKAAASVRWGCTTRQCWLNCGSTLQRNSHNFIGLDGDFIMTMHILTSQIKSCSFWLYLTLWPYSPNLAPCDYFLFPSLRQSSGAFDLRPLKQCPRKVRRFSRTWQRMACIMCSRNDSNAVRSAYN